MAYSTRAFSLHRRIFVSIFCLINMFIISDEANKTKPQTTTISVISENLSSTYRMVSGKGSFKDLKFYKECMAHEIFCHPAIWQFLMADISFNIALKRWKLHKLLKLISSSNFWFSSYIRPRLLWVKGAVIIYHLGGSEDFGGDQS